MAEGEAEGGLDDQLIDEAILGRRRGERGMGGRGELDRMMKRKKRRG